MGRFLRCLKAVSPAVLLPAALALAPAASAHPHVWVTVETSVLYESGAVTGFRHKWTFDEYYSRFAVEGRDENNDGTYDRQELKELAEVNVASLKEFEFFTFPKVSGKLLDREAPKDYWLEYKDGALTLFMTLPLKTPVPASQLAQFTFGVYDPTFYVDFALAKENPVQLSAAPSGCVPVIRQPNAQAIQNKSQTLSALPDDAEAPGGFAETVAPTISISCSPS
jgi:ABC-type uncharacterized transport system substrate-binding protein